MASRDGEKAVADVRLFESCGPLILGSFIRIVDVESGVVYWQCEWVVWFVCMGVTRRDCKTKN